MSLSFAANHTAHLLKHAPEVYWLLKLYYNDESNFTGVSNQDRTVNSNFYYGLVSSWGQGKQNLDLDNFVTNTSVQTIKLINTPNTVSGGRFSDLFSTNNYVGRRWELFQTDADNPLDTAAYQIAFGVIGGNPEYDGKTITLKLLDIDQKWDKEVPITLVDSTNYPRAPKENLDKPFPMFYGDADVDPNAPTVNAEFDRHFVKGHVPAIITDEWNTTNFDVGCHPDIQVLKQLRVKNLFLEEGGQYAACEDANVDVTGNPKITFNGSTWRTCLQLVGTGLNLVDKDFTTSYNIFSHAGNAFTDTESVGIPKISRMGEIVSISVIIDYDTANLAVAGGAPIDAGDVWKITIGGSDFNLSKAATDETINITAAANYTAAVLTAWDFEGSLLITLTTAGSAEQVTVPIFEIGIEIEFRPEISFEKTVSGGYRDVLVTPGYYREFGRRGDLEYAYPKYRRESITVTRSRPKIGNYVYISGTGRKYGAWIDTINTNARTDENGTEPDPNYASGDLIENPVYAIEEILRTELSLDPTSNGSDIDIETFDKAGNNQADATKGDIALTLNMAVANVKFMWSQFKFISGMGLIQNICAQYGLYFWPSGSGKYKIRSRLRPTDYASSDMTVDFNEISLRSYIKKTPIGQVRNHVTINYDYDYATEQTTKSRTPTDNASQEDGTSQGTGVGGYSRQPSVGSKASKLTFDMTTTRDQSTAEGYGDFLLLVYKDTKTIIEFETKRLNYNKLEIGDIIIFSNFPSDLKIFGTAIASSDYFMVTEMVRDPLTPRIKCVEVS